MRRVWFEGGRREVLIGRGSKEGKKIKNECVLDGKRGEEGRRGDV